MSTARIFRLGTRKSDLAKVQSNSILSQLARMNIHCELVEIESKGDREVNQPLYEIESESPGLFTKQLEQALLDNLIDLAVHSLKDLPTVQPPGLQVTCIPQRESVEDCLVLSPLKLETEESFGWKTHVGTPSSSGLGLKRGAVVGTSSLRREALLVREPLNLSVVPIRGNVPTRVQSVREGRYDAVILARAGLSRLGLDLSGLQINILSKNRFVPSPGQGALAVETRSREEGPLHNALFHLHDPATARCTRVERSILAGLHGGCTLPLGVYCEQSSRGLTLRAFLGIFERNTTPRKWVRFKHFDISDPSEETLVTRAIAHFREDINAMR